MLQRVRKVQNGCICAMKSAGALLRRAILELLRARGHHSAGQGGRITGVLIAAHPADANGTVVIAIR